MAALTSFAFLYLFRTLAEPTVVMEDERSVQEALMHLSCEGTPSNEKPYILHLAGSVEQSRIGVGLSDNTVNVHDISFLKKIKTCGKHKEPISSVIFSPLENNILYSASMDGTIKTWDLRVDNCVKEFKDDGAPSGKLKPLTSCDISCDGQFLCAGTEVFDGDSFLLFWDVRTAKLHGGYLDSHNDDITQIRYHPNEADTLISGSTDGVINVFDTKQATEEDALQSCLNTESSVDKIHWMKFGSKWNNLSCVTHTSDVQLWDIDGVAPELSLSRSTIAETLKCESEDDVFVVDVHQNLNDNSNIVVTYFTSETGTPLALLNLSNELRTITTFNENKQIVRCSWYDTKNDTLITGGEDGILSMWKPRNWKSVTAKSTLKAPSKKRSSKSKPY